MNEIARRSYVIELRVDPIDLAAVAISSLVMALDQLDSSHHITDAERAQLMEYRRLGEFLGGLILQGIRMPLPKAVEFQLMELCRRAQAATDKGRSLIALAAIAGTEGRA